MTPPAASPAASQQPLVASGLPAAYGTRRLVLTPRDPHWLHAHWDFTREQLRAANARSAEGHLTLKLFEGAAGGPLVIETRVHPESTRWFVHVHKPGARYVAQLGYHDERRKWSAVATSLPAQTPVGAPSAEGRFVMATLSADGTPTPHPVIPFPAEDWTPEQEQSVAQALQGLASPSAQEGLMDIAERTQPLPTSLSSAAWIPTEAPASLSSPVGGFVNQPQSLWLRVNAEVILYGATDPRATVKIGEHEIQLDDDGSFRFRFALPDGAYSLPVVATAADGADQRAVRLELSRNTVVQGEVGVLPQDSGLAPPPAKRD